MIDHHMGDFYLYDRDNRGLNLLTIQATNSPILADQAKTMAQLSAKPLNCFTESATSRTDGTTKW